MARQRISIEPFAPANENTYRNCVINFQGKDVTLEYEWGGKREIYTGQEVEGAPGKYRLQRTNTGVRGQAVLYKLPGSAKAMCRWREPNGTFGWMEIDLDDDDEFSS